MPSIEDIRMQSALHSQSGSAEQLIALLEEAPFTPTAEEEAKVRSVSEYGAWTLTHGHRFNHATVLLNALRLESEGIRRLADLNKFLREEGFAMVPAAGHDDNDDSAYSNRVDLKSCSRRSLLGGPLGLGIASQKPLFGPSPTLSRVSAETCQCWRQRL